MQKSQTPQAPNQALGAEIETLRVRNQTYRRVIGSALGTSIILAAASYFTLGFYEMAMAVRHHGRAMVLPHAPYLLLMLTFLPVGVIILILTAVNWNNHLTLYNNGLSLKRGFRKHIWTWNGTSRLDTRITHIKFGGSIINIRIHFILGNAEKTLTIRNRYEQMSEVIQQVRTKILPGLVDQSLEKIQRNQLIYFSQKLAINRQGPVIKGYQYDWDQINEPQIKRHRLILRESSNNRRIYQAHLTRITNLDLLIHLLKNSPTLKYHSASR